MIGYLGMTDEEYSEAKKSETKRQQEYAKKETELFDNNQIPVELRSAISDYAYEQGHAYGYNEILHLLDYLVDALKEPIKNFENRIRTETISKCLAGYR
jgi:hypothetical protein